MKRIDVLQTFRHAGQTYYAGEVRLVEDGDAGHFCGAGWARAAGIESGTPDTSPKSLDVQSSAIGQDADNAGVK